VTSRAQDAKRGVAIDRSSVTILNLGCGTKTSPECLNIDFSITARLRTSPIGRAAARLVLNGERRDRYMAIQGQVLVHDLTKGIPADDNSVDAVYHSHVLEHLDRVDYDVVPGFLYEIYRVLKPGGVHRVVVPDMAQLCREYLEHFDRCVSSQQIDAGHDKYIGAIIVQMVRREAYGTSLQRPLRRRIENLVLGDARRRGETHQWMYDQVNLAAALTASGFRNPEVVDYCTSRIPRWNDIGLDADEAGLPYKPGSLYMEALK
jgi:SAM-dependent methyltransferase